MNPYKVLQLPQDASFDQIKERYKHLSKNIHPDKHSIQNYQMAQARFYQIDQAYKSISTNLRRYVFKHYGPIGIKILENTPFHFLQFQHDELKDPLVLRKLNQVIKYCLYQEHASNQCDKSNLKVSTFLLVNKPLNKVKKFPRLENCTYDYQTSLPDLFGMTHGISIKHSSHGLSNQAQSGFQYGLVSSKRIGKSALMTISTNMDREKIGGDVNFNIPIKQNFRLGITPIILSNDNLHTPNIGADFIIGDYFYSGVTDFSNFTFHLGNGNIKKKGLKFDMKFGTSDNQFFMSPMFQYELTKFMKPFFQIQLKFTKAEEGELRVDTGFSYGYKINLGGQLKLQLVSTISLKQSVFNINISTQKFKVNVPIMSKSGNLGKFEVYKLLTFVTVYFCLVSFKFWSRRNERMRKNIWYNNMNRLEVEKNAVRKINDDSNLISSNSKQREIKYNGLVILMAYIGSSKAISKLKKKINQKINIKNHDSLQQLVTKSKEIILETPTNQEDFKHQLYEITQAIQSKVVGCQLDDFRAEQLRVNPCIDENEEYRILVLSVVRGQIKLMIKKKGWTINLGKMKERYRKPWYLQWFGCLKKKFVN